MRRTIVCDVDGVLADFSLGYTALAHEWYGTPRVGTKDRQSWDLLPGLTATQDYALWYAIRTDGKFWEQLPALCPADVFRRLQALQDDAAVYFATNRPGCTAKQQTERWLRAYGITNPTVIITGYKADFCRVVTADYAIDDKAGNAVAIQYGSTAQSYILDRLYNRFDSTVLGTRVKRVTTIEEFLTAIEDERGNQ
jgi:nicotinamidase-related amidase